MTDDRRQTDRQTDRQRYGEMCSYRRNRLRCKKRFHLNLETNFVFAFNFCRYRKVSRHRRNAWNRHKFYYFFHFSFPIPAVWRSLAGESDCYAADTIGRITGLARPSVRVSRTGPNLKIKSFGSAIALFVSSSLKITLTLSLTYSRITESDPWLWRPLAMADRHQIKRRTKIGVNVLQGGSDRRANL